MGIESGATHGGWEHLASSSAPGLMRLATMPPQQRTVLVLRCCEGLPDWEVTLGTDCHDELKITLDGQPVDVTLDPYGWLDTVRVVVSEAATGS